MANRRAPANVRAPISSPLRGRRGETRASLSLALRASARGGGEAPMKPPAASPGRAEKQLPAPPGLARLLLSKSRRGARSRRAPATSPMFVSRGRSAGRAAAAADGEPSSPKVTCIGQVRMRKGKGKKGAGAAALPKASPPEKGKGYCRCLKKAFLCGGLFDFDRRRRPKAPSPEVERSRWPAWVFSSRDVAVAAAPKPPSPRRDHGEDEEEEDEMEVGVGVFGSVERGEAGELGINDGDDKEDEEGEAELVSSATTTPPKNALLLMRCRSAPQNRLSPLTSRFPVAAPSLIKDAGAVEIAAAPGASPSPSKAEKVAVESEDEKRQQVVVVQEQEEEVGEEEEEDAEEEEEMRCSSARPLVLPRCKSEPATTAAAKMAAGTEAEATTAGCFWANGGSNGRRRHAPPPSPAAAVPVALAGH